MLKHPDINHLNTPMSTFIGREREIAEVKGSLFKNRLLTLTGPGGCGKTRLALRVAADLREVFEHGVWLVELASLSDAAFIPQAVATALGLREHAGADISQIVREYLASRHSLVIFDNCEHLITVTAQFADYLLQTCPNLHILATSREGLGVPGEAIWLVPPLSLPQLQPWTNPVSAQDSINFYMQSESVQLFIARATSASPTFTLTVENGAWVAEICRRLDGMPLAIELAAARLRALSVKEVAERLDDRFNLLTAGSRTAPLRQQTLAATLDWSYALLSEAEGRVLQRLSVFAGGATLEAAEWVCAGGVVTSREVLDTLSRLVDKSLIVADQNSPETRYRLLETIRQYALQKLAARGDRVVCRDRHLMFFIQWAEKVEPTLYFQDQLIGLERYEAEHDNLRAALEWSRAHEKNAKAGLRLAAACGRFWRIHGHFSEGSRYFSMALSARHAEERSIVRARALMFAANLAYLQSEFPAMRPLAEEAVSIFRELGRAGRAGLAFTLDLLGELETSEGNYPRAMTFYSEALDIYGELNDKKGIGEIHMQLGWAAMRTGGYQQAREHLEVFRSLAQETGDKTGLTYAYSGLGEVALRLGEYERALTMLEQGLSLSRERGDIWGTGTILGSLGWAALRQGDFRRMRDRLDESLSLRMEIGDKGGIAWCLEKLAEAAGLEGEYRKAVRIFACAAALRVPVGSVMDLADQPDYERILSGLMQRLGEEAYSAAWREGQAMPLKEAIKTAVSEPDRPADVASRSDKEKYGGLSKRERETAVLIAQGKSNREIAREMTVAEKTIETYVTRILNKLGFNSRVQIATWAMEKGLLPSIRR